tara:strand:- start:785 stop:1585 length:801 start_codon:yes stop_codon:yes gene_type:complete
MAEHKKHAHGGRHRQGYNDRLDESLAMRRGRKRQNFKDRRDESKGSEKSRLRRAYSSVGTMDRFDSPFRLARGGNSHNDSMSMLRKYDVRSPYGTYRKGGRPKKHMRAQGGDVYTGSRLSSAGDTKFTFKGEGNGNVYTGRDVSMMAARGKALRERYAMKKAQGGDVYSGSNLSSAGDTQFTFKGSSMGNETYTGRDISMMAAQGGEAYTGSGLSDAGNTDFTFTGQSGSNETYTGRDVNMMAARGKSLKKVKKASKGGETGIGMF